MTADQVLKLSDACKPKCKGMTMSRYDGEGNLLAASRPCRANASGDSDYCAQHDPVRKRRKALETELAERIAHGRRLGISYDRLLDWGAHNDKSADEVGAEMLRLKSEIIGQRRAAYTADPEVSQLASHLPTLPDDLFEVLAEQQTTLANVREGLRLAAYSPRDVGPWQLQVIAWAWTKAPVRELAAHEPQAACIILRDLASPDKGAVLRDVLDALTAAFSPKPRRTFASKRRPDTAFTASPFQSWKESNAEFLAALKEYNNDHPNQDFTAQLVERVYSDHRALSARQVEVAREIMSRPEPRVARTPSIVFEVRNLFRGELQDVYPDLTADDLHVLEVLTSDALYDRTSADYLWVSPGLSTFDYLARRTRLPRADVEIAVHYLATKWWLIDSDGCCRYTIEPLAVKLLGVDRVGEVPNSVVRHEVPVRKYEAHTEAAL